MLLRKIMTICCICFFSSNAISQNFKSYHFESGLQSKYIRSIEKDSNGYLWIGTIKGLYKFDGYEFKSIDFDSKHLNPDIKKIYLSSNNALWVITDDNRLYQLKDNQWSKIPFKLSKNSPTIKIYTVLEFNKQLFFGSNIGLFQYSLEKSEFIENNENLEKQFNHKITSIYQNNETLIIASKNNIIFTNKDFFILKKIALKKDNTFVHDFFLQENHYLWIGTNKGLLKYDLSKNEYVPTHIPINSRVMSLKEKFHTLWISTLEEGLFKIDLHTSEFSNFKHASHNLNSLSSNKLTTLFLSKSNILWIGTFNQGLSQLNLNSLSFKLINNKNSCLKSNEVLDYKTEKNNRLYLANENNIVEVQDKKCNITQLSISKTDIVYSFRIADQLIWLSTSSGLKLLNKKTKKPLLLNELPNKDILFSLEHNGKVYLGSGNGLHQYKYDNLTFTEHKVLVDNTRFFDYIFDGNNIYFLSAKGLYKVDNNSSISMVLKNNSITSIFMDENNVFYLSILNQGLFILKNNSLIKQFDNDYQELFNTSIASIEEDGQGNLWMGSDRGLIRFNKQNKSAHLFKKSDGISSNYFLDFSSYKSNSGALYFGGDNGIVYFEPQEIHLNHQPFQIAITDFYLQNKKVKVNNKTKNGFILNKSINDKHTLNLNYKDTIIGFKLAALNFEDPSRNKFLYRLKGQNDNWFEVNANNRLITFTNLAAGNYSFQVKAINKDGIFSANIKELIIYKKPALWFSNLAYLLYITFFFILLYWYIKLKIRNAENQALKLELTVQKRTKEINKQKEVIEKLFQDKKEVFANITHEFRTPLTLILGNTHLLMNELDLSKNRKKLLLIKKSANRLLVMVGHILNISQSEQDLEQVKEPQNIKSILLMLNESYQPLAKIKNITLNFSIINEVSIMATRQCLEIIISNLISNALKFTQKGGEVSVFTELVNSTIAINVKDNGSGIEKSDLKNIFNRFNRLDKHLNIQGTGLGLSVVKSLTEANNGTITVKSELNYGSLFTLKFLCDHTSTNEIQQTSQITQNKNLIENTRVELVDKTPLINSQINKSELASVLIIDDNIDIQNYINEVLKNTFNCCFVNSGKKGIALALKSIPDIIVCDIMMPQMNGYEVTKILRKEEKTSHIPIILLTALNTQESRIKGWRSNIDMYMTKPFDSNELIANLYSILKIRKIIQRKTSVKIKEKSSLVFEDLSQQDAIFINKLQSVIEKNYHNQYFLKPQFASKMAYSESQLLRKVTALIEDNPMDMLRHYRLEMAAIKLKKGYQVSQVSSSCGFNSVSYFGKCFKNKYGVSPKKYQQIT